jgi:hypothetical protein
MVPEQDNADAPPEGGTKTADGPLQHTVRYTELSPDRFKDFWR